MSMIPVFNFLRITPRNETFLNGRRGQRGEVFYDRESGTLRIFSGDNQGGVSLVKDDLSNVSNSIFLAKATAAGISSTLADVAASGDYNDLINVPSIPSTLNDLGIFDGDPGQVLTTDGNGNYSFQEVANVGSFVFTGTNISTDDSSSITIMPSVIFNSDVTIENEVILKNNVTIEKKLIVDDILLQGEFSTQGSGIPELSSDNEILLTAGTRVEITSSPIKMCSFSSSDRDLLAPQNGDMIYNLTTNKFQGYANNLWVDLH